MEAGAAQADKTSSYYRICLPMQIIHQESGSELRRSLALVALADAAALEEVKEELRRDTGAAQRRMDVSWGGASSQKWVSGEVPATFPCV